MADLGEEDLKFVLGVDPDMDAFNKAVNQINAEIDAANVSKIKMGLMGGPGAPTQVPGKEGKSDTEELLGAALGGGDVLGQVGGMAGEAIGGPIGAVVGAMIKKIPEIVAGPMKLMTAGLRGVSGALSDMQGPLGPVGAGLGLASKALEGLASTVGKLVPILGPFLEELAAVPGIFKDILSSLTGMAEKAAPGVIKQFNFAIEDAQATIGQAFIPVVQLMTEATRLFSEVMANVLPNTREMGEVLRPLRDAFAELRDAMRDVMQELGPLIRAELIGNLKLTAMVLAGVARMAADAARNLKTLLGPLADLLGLGGGGLRQPTTAARQATMGSIEEYQRQLQLQTYSIGGGNDVPTNVNSIAQAVRNIEAWFAKMQPDAIIGLIATGISGLGGNVVREKLSKAEEAVGNAQAWEKRMRKKYGLI